MTTIGDLLKERDRMLYQQSQERSTLYDVVCQVCSHHQVTRNIPTTCIKCSSLLISVLPVKGTVMTR